MTQQQLGRAIGMDPSSMVSTIDELEAKGWVERRRHPTDRRAYALHITERGPRDAHPRPAARGQRPATSCWRRWMTPSERSSTRCYCASLAGAVAEAGTGAATDPIGFRDPPPSPSTGDG